MRIALTCTEKLPVPPIAGGAVQLYIDGTMPFLSKKHELTLYSIQYPGLPEVETINNIRHIRLPGGTSKIYLNSLKKALDDTYDLIHVFNRPRYAVQLMRLLPQAKLSLSLHNEMFHPEKISDEDGRQLVDRVEFINTVSRYIANTVAARFPSAESKLRVVYSGVNTRLFRPVWSTEGKQCKNDMKHSLGLDDYKVVLFVGRLSIKKGVHILINAMENVMASKPKTALVIVGSKWFGRNESDEYTLSLKAKAAALKGPVIFTGFLPPSQIYKYYCVGDVFVCPSQWNEPLARVHYEAMAAGLPIITTDRGGNAEVVGGRGNGFVLTDYSSPNAMADKILFLLQNPSEALKMGGQGRLMAERNFSWERVAGEIFPDSMPKPDNTVTAAIPTETEIPAVTESLSAPLVPTETEIPAVPDNLTAPVVPVEPDVQAVPENLTEPVVPAEADITAVPENVTTPVVPAEQDIPEPANATMADTDTN